MVYTDLLTKLENRQKLITDIKDSNSLKLALVNVKNFHKITTIYGNETGDSLLINCGDIVRTFAESKGFRAYKVKTSVYAVLAADKIVDNAFIESIIELQRILGDTTYKCLNTDEVIDITARVSIVANEENRILEKAEMALGYAKLHSLDFQIYHSLLDTTEGYKNQLIWTKKINEAIKEDRVIPYYQPIYNNETSEFDNYEALIRIISRTGEVISPYFFLEISRKTGLYPKLTRILVRKVFEKFRGQNKQVNINLLLEDIKNEETRQLILNGLKDKSLAKCIIFEIVEVEEINDFEEIIRFTKQIRELGAQVALDDFGVGYSNFGYLLKLNVDFIKIDGSIIKNICNDVASERVAQAITELANGLGARVVAEFVENENISNKVKKMGITYSQGYYHSAPKADIDL